MLDKIFHHDSIRNYTNLSEEEIRTLTDNRRFFVEEFAVTGEIGGKSNALYSLKNAFKYNLGELDHLRVYKCLYGKIILVCSNYGVKPPAILGMAQMDHIYHPFATTYFKVFEHASFFRSFVSALASLKQAGELDRIEQTLKTHV